MTASGLEKEMMTLLLRQRGMMKEEAPMLFKEEQEITIKLQ